MTSRAIGADEISGRHDAESIFRRQALLFALSPRLRPRHCGRFPREVADNAEQHAAAGSSPTFHDFARRRAHAGA